MTRRLLLVLTLIGALGSPVAFAAPITGIVVIGDSLSDGGNGFALTGGAFPPAPYAQRASNGPVAVEYMAQLLGVPLLPAALGGSNYAVLGALTGTENFAAATYSQPALANTGMLAQTAQYLGSAAVIDPAGTLFVVWGGPNDFFVDPSAASAATALNNLATTISALYAAGARRFLVPNMADLSLTPSGLALPPNLAANLQALTIGFNTGLDGTLDSLELLLTGLDITRFDTFTLMTMIAANPGAFGFSNATQPCITGILTGSPTICADPSSFVFWDSVHPTTAAHQVLGAAFARSVPEPATLSLLLVAGAVGLRARRRRTGRHGRTV